MAWQRKDDSEHRECVVCGEAFDRAARGYSAITCDAVCQRVRQLGKSSAYRREHLEENREAVRRYKARLKADA